METAREKINETDEQIEADFGKLGYGIAASVDEQDIAYLPTDEIDRIRADRKNWSDSGRIEKDTGDVLIIEGAQATREQRRRSVVVIRYSGGCAVYGADN